MKPAYILAVLATLVVQPAISQAQRSQKRDADFIKSRPAVGDMLPDVSIFDSSGRPFEVADLRGHYTVLVFGCLT